MEVVDNIPVINLRNGITVSEVPLDVVVEGFIGLFDDAGQIPSGFGTRAGCLVVLDEGVAKILPAVNEPAGSTSSQLRAWQPIMTGK